VRAPIDALQTSTGVKDVITQHWIEDLLIRYQNRAGEGIPSLEIEKELKTWVRANEAQIYNGHLTT
jgi:hypothetical protein